MSRHRDEYWRYTELRALSFLVAVGAIGYAASDTLGFSLADALTYAISGWVIWAAFCWFPKTGDD